MDKDRKKTLNDQLDAMTRKLEEAAEQMPRECLIVDYDNGGGQSGTHENPFYSAYTKLVSCYIKTWAAVNSDKGGNAEDKTSVEELRARFKVAK